MNKIYKVIWSKVRNCYVAVSEIAKRNGKCCTSVNCGAKANRGHSGVALALALSLSMAGGGIAWAEDVTANTTINTDKSSTVYKITAESITFTVGSAGSIQAVYNDPARNGNTITVASGGKVTGNCGSVTSGNLSDCGIGLNGSNNTVTINGRVEEGVYGGYSGADAINNTVTVNTGGYVGGFITGSRTSATFNRENAQGTVTINGGTVKGEVIGSRVYGSGTATGTVNIKGGTVGDINKSIMGSYTTGGWYSTYNSKSMGTVKIEGGTVIGNVYGAFTNEGTSDDSANSGTATGTVTITGGTMNRLVCGGTSHYGKATGSVVTISGGTINWNIRGGSSYYYSATGNTVTINAGTIDGKVYGGESYYGSATGNTVSLGGVEIGGHVLGGASDNQDNTNDLVTGNKLILTKSGNSSTGSVYNFETIEFSNTLGWTTNGTVLSANSFPDNADGSRATLNISNSKLSSATTKGTMTLLKSNQANDFNKLSLIYSGGTANLTSSNQKKDVKTGTETTESSPVNGVTLKYKDVHTVSLDAANSYKNVLYTIGQKSTGITLGTVTYAKNGTARSFDNTYDLSGATIDANNLKFTDASQKNMEPGDTMTIVDASSAIKNASGLALPSFTSKTYNTAYTDTISGKGITFKGTHTDTLSQSTDTAKSKLIYTIGDKKVSSAALTGAVTWSNGSTYYTNSKYKFNTNATTNLSGLSFGTVSSDPYGQSMTLISGNVAGTVSNAPASFAVSVNKTNTTLGATASGSASIASSKLTYKVNGVALNKVTVKSVGNTADAVPANWTLKSGATVETGSMTVPTGLSAGAKKVIISASGTNYFNGITINGGNAWGEGTALTTNLSSGGVTIAGKQTKAGVKVNEANKNQLVYEASKKNITGITLDTVTYAKNGTARSFDNTYDLSGATIDANNLKFTDASQKNMEPGDTMTIVDASSAIKNASGLALPSFTSKTYNTAYTDTISGKGITFKGTHTDTLSQSTDTAKSKLIYTIGDKKVSSAALTGAVTWSNGSTYYTNSKYKFNTNATTNLSGLSFGTVSSDPYGQSMTLISGNVAGTVSNAPASFAVSVNKTNTTLGATASGSASIASSKLTYKVNGVALNKVTVKSVGNTADAVPANWTLKSGATVETGSMTVPTGLSAGAKKVIISASGTNYFNGITINGGNAWGEGTALTTNLSSGGVTIAGKQTKAGVKVNEANKNQLVYEASKKNITGITLDTVTYAKNGTARSFDNTYDLSGATIDANNLKFTDASQKNMEPGDTMTIVDASSAIKNTSGLALPSFTSKTYNTAYTDTISGKGITFKGTHTDTLSQSTDTAKSKLIYTIGDKKVNNATISGTINWSDGGTHYTNGSEANQNGTNVNYKFDGSSAVDISGVAFNATVDPLAGSIKSMTLLKGVTGVVATKVSGTPSFTVDLDKTNTKLDAKASGLAGVSGNDVIYTVNDVAIDKINVKRVGDTADVVPENWTLASGATVETDGMTVTVPSGLNHGQKKTIITAGVTDYFDGIMINGSNAWSAGTELTGNLTVGGVTITGTQTKGGVKVNEANKSQIVYEESKKNATSITLGEVTYAKNGTARSFDSEYDVSVAAVDAGGLTFTSDSKTLMETGDSMTIVDAASAIANSITGHNLSAFTDKEYTLDYTDTITEKGITFKGKHTDTLSQDAEQTTLTYTVGEKVVSNATLSGTINWSDGGTHYANGSDANQNGTSATYTFNENTAVDISGVAFSATTDPLGKSMTLLKGVTGVAESKISGTPSFAVALDKSNTKLDAKASGSAGVSGNDVTYAVSDVAIDKINVKSIANDADTVPDGWTLAKDDSDKVIATVETDGLSISDPSGLEPGETKVVIEAAAGSADYFKDAAVNGSYAWKVDGSDITSDLDIGGVAITGTQTKGGVKVNEADTNQIIYEESKKLINTLALGNVTFKMDDGTAATVARTFDKTYDVSTATISADDLAFTNSDIMETGNTMRIVDASAAIPNAVSKKKLPVFEVQTYDVDFTDTITEKGITFKGKHTDTLSQDAEQTTLTYTVGEKVVSNAILSGTINWSDDGTHYTNSSDANQNGTSATYTFNENTAVDISGVAFSATTDPLGKSMTLLKGVTGVAESKISGTPSFAVALDKSNTKLDAKASGSAGVSGNDVTYAVSDVAIDKINVKSIANDADTVPDGWTLAKDDSDKVIATVETDGLSISDPSGLEPGETKVVIEAAAGSTDYFKDVAVNGSYAWKVDGSDITSDLDIGGVAITGTQTKGGVKVNEADTNQIIYEESKKLINTLALGNVTFKMDDGTAATVARTFDKTYDVSTATISADDLAFTNSDIMETGNTMRIVDASAAIPNAVSKKKLPVFEVQTYDVDFTDTITEKGITFKGKHTDTLSQDAEQTTLTYTVGEKVVSNATLSGTINWSDDGTHYTNSSDANQNGTSATYTFNENTAVDISGVAFSATTDPLGKSMTLLKGVTGVAESKISGTPSFAVALDKSNTKLDAKASGSAGVSGNDVTYAVSDVAIDKINVKSIANDADTVPDGWTLAKDDSDKVIATVETDGLSISDPSGLEPGETKVVIEAAAGSTDYFKDVAVNGSYAWKVDGSDITSDLDIGGVAITGTQTKGGVKVNEADTNQIIYEESKKLINTLALGNVTFKMDDGTAATVARTFDKTYDVSTATISADDLAFTNSDIMETGNTMRIVDASAAIPNAVSKKKLPVFEVQTYDVDFTDTITEKGITFKGKHTDTLSQDAEQTTLTYTVGEKVVSNATLSGTINWSDDGTHYTNSSDANQNGTSATYTFNENTAVDISGVAFSATTDPLGKSMTLLKGVTGVAESKISGTPSFAVALDKSNTKLDAKASGSAGVSGNDVTYAVSDVAIDKINVKSIANDADTVPDGWTLAKDDSDKVIATVETDGLSISDPSGLEPGETKVVIEAAAGSTDYFKDVAVNGSYAWKVDGSDITSDLDIGGVAITGTQTKGGVKVNEADTNQIIYEESKKLINTLALGNVTFKMDDGTAATVARTFDKTYDVSTATISADDLAFTNSDIMETGNTMRIVDASAAIPNAVSKKKLPVFEVQTYDVDFTDTITGKGVTFTGKHTDTLSQDAGQTTLTYTVGEKVVSNATLSGTINWSDDGTHYTNGSDANQNGTKATYTFNENSAVDVSGVAFKATTDPLAGPTKSMILLKGVTGVAEDKISGTPSFAVTLDQTNTKLEATATGAASVDETGSLKYTVAAVELNTVTVNGTGNDVLPESWTVPEDVVIDTEDMTVPTDLAAGESKTILTAGVTNLFSDEDITGANAYSTSDFTDTDAANIVTLTGTQGRGVTTADEGKSLVYKVGFKEVDNIDIGAVAWEKGATVMDGSTGYDYGNVTAIGTDNFDVTYDTPEKVAAGESMTLLKANETLKDMAAGSKSASYSFEPVAGVTVDAALTGNLAAKGGAVTYTVDANRASKLTFGGVEWKDAGALLARPANIVFAGADVDTSNISFTNVSYLDANRKMTLVSDFGDSVGNITGKKYEVGKYTIGTAFEGEGTASLSGGDLVFTTTTDAGLTGQTHKTVMAMDAGLAMLLTGNEFVGKTMDGMAEVKNKGKDGVSTFASVGGGASRYTTGSHVSTHTWNAVVGVGKTNETKKGTMEYGVFGEYGKGSYTLHSDDGNGDGDAYYAGGGLLAKWTNKHDVYTEASIRAGRLSDSSGDIMQDGLGNKYGYDVHANYYGAHAGVGKIINYKGGKSLDVYGKFFYLKRDGVEYDAVQHYNLDSVSSSILRIGGRYGTTDKKWNWYGGLAYEYEFDGEAKGVVNGKAIRAASVKGSSVRGEFGLRMDATKTNPWQTDVSLYGYAGKHRGFGGNVSVVYTF